MNVAKTIIDQLGGNRFIAMTGAKFLVAEENALSFKLPSNFAKDGINFVKITLTPADLYKVEFKKIRGLTVKDISEFDDVYCDMLQELFTEETGLATHL